MGLASIEEGKAYITRFKNTFKSLSRSVAYYVLCMCMYVYVYIYIYVCVCKYVACLITRAFCQRIDKGYVLHFFHVHATLTCG